MSRVHLPRWAYLLLAVPCAAAGVWAAGVTLRYFIHGAQALETDPALQVLAVAAAVLLTVLGMAAFGLAAVLTEKQLWARRWALSAFSGAILLLEMVTIGAVQGALVIGAALSQASIGGDVADLEKQIGDNEKQAARYIATASALRINNQLTLAKRTEDKAAEETAKNEGLYKQLSDARKAKRPTLSGLLGERAALIYAVIRGMLISLGGMVFLGVAGAMLRLGLQGADAPAEVRRLDAPTKPTPGLAMQALRWLGVLVGGGAAVASAQAAPAESSQPAPAKPAPGAPVCTPADADAPAPAAPVTPAKPASAPDAPAPKPALDKLAALAPSAPAQVQDAASAEPDAPGKVQVQSVRRKLPDGVREAVRSGAVRPTQAGLKSLGVGQGYAAEWLTQMGVEGILESNGKGGWVLNEDNV